MINTRYATLNQTPEVLDIVRVDLAIDIYLGTMHNPLVFVAKSGYMVIARKFICVKNRIKSYILSDKRNEGGSLYIRNSGSHQLASPLHNSNNSNFAFSSPSTFSVPNTAKVGLVSFNLACEDGICFGKQYPNLLEHTPSGFVCDLEFPFNLLSGDSASSGSHSVHNLKPNPERRGRLVKDCTRSRVNMVATVIAGIARAFRDLVVLCHSLAVWALDAVRPAMVLNPLKASIIIRESPVKVFDCKLSHSRSVFHFPIPHSQVLYHNSYLLSRDSCLN